MGDSIKRRFRACFWKRFLCALGWTIVWCAAWLAGIEFFYGPGTDFLERSPYLLGGLAAVGLVGILVSFGFLVAHLFSLLTFRGALRRSMRNYQPNVEDPYDVLDGDIRYQLVGCVDIYLGCDWIVFPAHAMQRDAVTGIYMEALSQRYLSKKSRLWIYDDARQDSMYLDLRPDQNPDFIYQYLSEMHPRAMHGTRQRRQSVQAISDFQAKKAEEPSAPLGFSRWDKSPILEENHIRSVYERWILTSYSLYVFADAFHDGDFSCVGGYERTEYQKKSMACILRDSWEIEDRRELMDTVGHLVRTGRQRRDGWQLGRAPMLLGFGYIAELISRAELLEYSLGTAKAIQESFSSWQELFDSYMLGFEAWAKDHKIWITNRRKAYQAMLRDPNSLMNTVNFHADVERLCWDAMDWLGVRR